MRKSISIKGNIIDLHTHTTYSDGELTPYELISKAKSIGCSRIAITDHDTVAGIAEGRKAASELGIEFVAGIEISTQEKEEVHILGYDIDENNALLRQKCQEFADSREKRAELICEFFARRGIVISLEEIREIAGGEIIGRPHFAAYLEKHGFVSSRKEAFSRYLNTYAFHAEVTRKKPTPEEAIALIHEAGGKAVLAHPGFLKKNSMEVDLFVATLKRAGLDGLECFYLKHTPSQTQYFLALARKYNLKTGCGSDFHGEHVKPDVELGMKLEFDRLVDVPLVVE